MKKVYLGLVALLTVAVFANCGNNNNNNSNNASAAMAATCYLMETSSTASVYTQPTPYPVAGAATCTPSSYTQYTGFTPISGVGGGYGYSGYSSYIGSTPSCTTGYDVVYSPSLGLGCVSTTSILGNGQPVMYSLSAGTQAFVTVSTFNPALLQYQQQYSTTSAYGGYSTYGGAYGAAQNLGVTTSGEVLRVCSAVELCPSGQNCRSPFGVNTTSTLGVCYY